MATLTHLDEDGHPRMVNVGQKADTERLAVAEGSVRMSAHALECITSGAVSKGDVLSIARLASGRGGCRVEVEDEGKPHHHLLPPSVGNQAPMAGAAKEVASGDIAGPAGRVRSPPQPAQGSVASHGRPLERST